MGLPGLVSDLHPGPVRRLGKSQGSSLFRPSGSPSVPKVAVKGTPSLALKIAPISQPLVIHAAAPENDLREGTCQVPLITKGRPILKSERPRIDLKSYEGKPEIEFENWSPILFAEPVSMLFPQVKEPCSSTPWLIAF